MCPLLDGRLLLIGALPIGGAIVFNPAPQVGTRGFILIKFRLSTEARAHTQTHAFAPLSFSPYNRYRESSREVAIGKFIVLLILIPFLRIKKYTFTPLHFFSSIETPPFTLSVDKARPCTFVLYKVLGFDSNGFIRNEEGRSSKVFIWDFFN